MNRKFLILLLISLFFIAPIFAQEESLEQELQTSEYNFISYFADDILIPDYIRNNKSYLESTRLTAVAQEAYELADYAQKESLEQTFQTSEYNFISYFADDILIPDYIRNNKSYLESTRLTAVAQEAYELADYANKESLEQTLQMLEYNFLSYFADDILVPDYIRNNKFYLESTRLTVLAQEAYELGDYDASHDYAQEAIINAHLSDQYVASQLLTEAKRLLDWADRDNTILVQFTNNYNEAKYHYNTAVQAHSDEKWNDSIGAAIKAIEILAALEANRTPPVYTADGNSSSSSSSSGLPRQYTVRTWIVERDCLWNIAGYPWVYGDPRRWVDLYEANKSKLPDPNNPNLIEPGMILDIPSIKGEVRQGMWSPN